MSNNLANLMVGFGLDLSALQKDAPEAFRILNSQTLGMSAEMKRASREGAESFRLIDEALGIHVSRPLTRILTREFPDFAKALQSVLGVGVAGALGAIAFEAFEKVSKSIEKAQHAQEAFADSTRKAKETFEDIMTSFAKDEELHSLTGIGKKLFEIDSSTVQETRSKIEQLTKALEENAKAAREAGGWWVKFKAGVGNAAEALFSSPNAANAEKLDTQLSQFTNKLHELGNIDARNQTHYSAAAISAELDVATRKLQALQADVGKVVTTPAVGPGAVPQSRLLVSPEEVEAQQRYIDDLKQIQQIQNAGGVDQGIKDNDAKSVAAVEARKKAIHDFQEEAKDWNEAAKEASKSWKTLNDELNKVDDRYEVLGKLGEISLKDLAQRAKELEKLNGPLFKVAPPQGAPMLSDQAELLKITNDQTEAWKKGGEIVNQIETPLEKYNTGLKILNELEHQHVLTAAQVAQATQLLGEQFTKAELHMLAMEKQLDKLLSHSTSAGDGVKAFFLQLEINAGQNGKMAFDLLNQGLKGFEDELTKAVFTGKAKWEDMFRSLAESAFKFMLNKDIANMFQMFSGTGLGKSLHLDSLMPKPGQGAEVAALAANTTGVTANTAAVVANTAALTTTGAGAAAGGGGGSGILGDLLGPTGYASGTDDAPGGLAWVGERGPELLNLPGGTSVTPAASLRSGGDTHIYHIDAKGAEIGVEEKIVRALQAAEPRFIGKAITNFSEIQRRTPQTR